MNDQSAARDRAIDLVEEELARLAERVVPDDVAAAALVDSLLANPEMLRALAGAPDVTAAGWPARFRAAAAAAEALDWDDVAGRLRQVANSMARYMPSDEVEAIGRALLDEPDNGR